MADAGAGHGRRVLLDSSAWISFFRGESESLRSEIDGLLSEKRAVAAWPIRVELLNGARSRPEFEAINRRLQALENLSVREEDWAGSAELGFRLNLRGETVPAMYLLIATLALANDCELLHMDADFERVRRVAPLRTRFRRHRS